MLLFKPQDLETFTLHLLRLHIEPIESLEDLHNLYGKTDTCTFISLKESVRCIVSHQERRIVSITEVTDVQLRIAKSFFGRLEKERT